MEVDVRANAYNGLKLPLVRACRRYEGCVRVAPGRLVNFREIAVVSSVEKWTNFIEIGSVSPCVSSEKGTDNTRRD